MAQPPKSEKHGEFEVTAQFLIEVQPSSIRNSFQKLFAGVPSYQPKGRPWSARVHTNQSAFSPKADLLNRIKLIPPVQSLPKKYFPSPPTQITSIFATVSSHLRGGSRSSRTRGGMRWTQAMLLTRASTADGEVVWS
jgi:hypothetical protein